MLIQNLKEFFHTPIKGVIHIGAHLAEEKTWYNQNSIQKVLWIEANENYYNEIKKVVGDDDVIVCAISNQSGTQKFNISNNGQSSSLLELDLHKVYHPDVNYINSKEVKVRRMTDLVSENNIEINNFNFINLDIQGSELDALKSFDDYLENFDYIYSEVNVQHLYKDCALLSEMDEYLSKFHFVRVATEITQWQWGDAFYVKKSN